MSMSDLPHPAIARLDRASADLVERASLDAQLAEAQDLLHRASDRCDRLERQLVDEERDVDRLEGVSLRRVVTAIRGSREAALDRERAEVDTVASALARADSERAALRDAGRSILVKEENTFAARLRAILHWADGQPRN